MKLRELNIKNFGKFYNHSISLEDGINLIYGENEAGKSTIHAFIRSMLFGLTKQRGRASKTDMYHQYEPCENPGFYAGALRFESGGRHFRLERNFSRENFREELICEDDGERLSVADGDLRMLLGGISRSIYDNTVSVGQMKSKTDEELIRALRNYMANYQGDVDQETNLEEAIKSLKARKKEQEEKRDVLRFRLEEKERQLQSRMEFVQEELKHKTDSLEQTGAQYHIKASAQRPEHEGEHTNHKNRLNRKKTYTAAAAIALFILLGLLIVLKVPGIAARGGLLAAIAVLIGLTVRIWIHPHKDKIHADEAEDESLKLQWNMKYLQSDIIEQQMILEEMRAEEQELQRTMAEPSEYEEEIKAIELAMQVIADIALTMQQEISRQLKEKISEIMYELTGGRYTQVTIDESFEILLHTRETCIPIYQVSSGTVEQVYFALRMAVMDILCKEEDMPLILDEVFAMYDEKRLERALRWLHGNRGQVLLFTCHDREERLLNRLGIPYHKVKLGGKYD